MIKEQLSLEDRHTDKESILAKMASLSKSFTFLFLFSSLISNICAQTVPAPGSCSLRLKRLVGRSSQYVYTCDCVQNGRLNTIARADVDIPPGDGDNAAQAAAAIRCILNQDAHLLSVCYQSPRRFDLATKRTLDRCLTAPTTAADRQLPGKFSFSTDSCEARFETFFSVVNAGVWICTCPNATNAYDVIVGRSGFRTDSSPLGGVEETEFLRECSLPFVSEANRVCRQHVENFEVSTLQWLKVCCERARVHFSMEKLECEDIVPDDLSPFMALR